MNQRIKELAEQAGVTVLTTHGMEYVVDGCYVIGPARLEKFAELIVAECVGIVDKIVPPGYADYPDYRDQIEQAFRSECTTEIKKHFGVEE